ncbi:MAG: aldose 1-epimerase family protein [Spirochaetia bacterium]|jgi:hypothetical protein
MAWYAGRKWTRGELTARIGDPLQVAGARGSILTDGKADGVRAVEVATGSGLTFTVLPGRGMDIPFAAYRGKSLSFFSGTGITSPAYYDETGLEWRRSFYVGLLTTCGIANAGAPGMDQGKAFGLHGRVANAAAENLCIDQEWEGDEFLIRLKGTMREAEAMVENLSLTRTVETRLGAKGLRIHDTARNRGFSPQPLMLLYHFNFGFPLLAPGAKVVGPITKSVPRDDEARKDRGVEECLSFPDPVQGYAEKVFFHALAERGDGSTFVALVNRDAGDGQPLGIVMRWSRKELPELTEWKMPCRGFYVVGLEPGNILPIGRGTLRQQGALPMIEGQASYDVTIDFEVLDTAAEIDAIEGEARKLAGV